LQWIGQPVDNWSPVKDAAYADANGNGKVDQADIMAVGFNWDKQHSMPKLLAENQTYPTVSCGELKPILSNGSNQKQEILLEIFAENLTELFGMTFELNYPKHELEFLSVEQGNLFAQNAIFFKKENLENGKILIALSQKAGQSGINDNGLLLRFVFKRKSNEVSIDGNDFRIDDCLAKNKNGELVGLTLSPVSDVNFETTNSAKTINQFKLFANYPNPFNPTTTIFYSLPEASHVKLQIFDLNGRAVRILLNAKQPTGIHSVLWNAKDEKGNKVTSGIYICTLRVGETVLNQKLILAK